MTQTDTEILDAEIVDEHTDEAPAGGTAGQQHERQAAGEGRLVGPVRRRMQALRAAAADPDERAQARSWVTEQTRLIADGLRHRQLVRRERETLAEYREHGNPDAPVREDLRVHYERTLERREKRAAEAGDEWSVEDYVRTGAWSALGFGEFALFAEVFGSAPGLLGALAPLFGVGNLVAAPILARRLARQGQAYRDKLAAWELGCQPGDAEAETAGAGAVSIDYLTAALQDAGVLGTGESVSLAEPIRFDDYGWVARMVLPRTKSAGAVLKAHERLTSALGANLKKQQVKITPETPRIVALRVYNTLPFTGSPVPHPLLDSGRGHSVIRDGIPVGLDINGTVISVDVADDLHGLVVAASGMGKTVQVRNLATTVLHSIDAEIGGIFDGKASGDYDVVRTGIGWYLDTMESGPDWWDKLAGALEAEVAGAMQRQQRIRRGEQLGLRFVILDEFQMGFGGPGDRGKDKDTGEWKPAARVVQACEEISRLGRSAGVRLILASQSFDGNVLPSAILNNVLWRLVGYVSSETMPPKDTVGAEGLGYGLIPDQTFTKAQKGAVICLSSSQEDGYAICRGWYQDSTVIADDVREVAPAAAPGDATPGEPGGDAGETSRTPSAPATTELSAEQQALLRTVLEVYGDDDAEWIPTQQLMLEVAVGELEWTADPDDRAMTMRVAELLTAAGATKKRARSLPGDPMAWHRPGLVTAARTALAA